MMIIMINCFCGKSDRRKACRLISSRDHCQISSTSRISDMPLEGFEPAESEFKFCLMKLSSGDHHTTTLHRHLEGNTFKPVDKDILYLYKICELLVQNIFCSQFCPNTMKLHKVLKIYFLNINMVFTKITIRSII